jgi:protein SCO1/2
MKPRTTALLALVLMLTGIAGTARAGDLPPMLRGVGVDQKLGSAIPFDLRFHDDTGATVQLSEYFDQKPVILVLAYYRCPRLCNLVLNNLVRSLLDSSWEIGADFTIITVSIDPREGPELAAAKKHHYLQRYGRAGAAAGWHFLTGEEAAIKKLAAAVGFNYRYDPKDDQFIHASCITVLTPKGRISRYFLDLDYRTWDLEMALREARQNHTSSSIIDQVLLYCFHYDPASGRYGLIVMNLVRLGGVLTVLTIGGFLFVAWRRERRRARNQMALEPVLDGLKPVLRR